MDFIRIGCDRATLEIEIRNDADNEGNIHITREIFKEATEGNVMKEKNQSKHCRWFLHNKEVKEGVIKKIVKDLNIQTDNLCQFLPQGLLSYRQEDLDDCSTECDIFFFFSFRQGSRLFKA